MNESNSNRIGKSEAVNSVLAAATARAAAAARHARSEQAGGRTQADIASTGHKTKKR